MIPSHLDLYVFEHPCIELQLFSKKLMHFYDWTQQELSGAPKLSQLLAFSDFLCCDWSISQVSYQY